MYIAVYSRNHGRIGPEKVMPFVVEERGNENVLPEACLYQRRLRDGERAYFHTLPSCHIDGKSSQRKNSRLFAGIRCALE